MEIKGVIVSGIEIGKSVKYDCLRCGKKAHLEFRLSMTKKTKRLFIEAAGKRICMSCLLGEDHRVKGAADNLIGLMVH